MRFGTLKNGGKPENQNPINENKTGSVNKNLSSTFYIRYGNGQYYRRHYIPGRIVHTFSRRVAPVSHLASPVENDAGCRAV